MTADPKLPGEPLTSGEPLTAEQVAGWRAYWAKATVGRHGMKMLCDSHEALREALRRAEAERDAMLLQARSWAMEAKSQRHTVNEVGSALGGIPDWGPIAESVRGAIAERNDALLNVRRAIGEATACQTQAENLRAELAKLREALEWYADPETWEQVDLLGRCPLSDDRDDEGLLGMRAREAIGPHISDALGSIRAALTPTPGSSAGGNGAQ